jgi:anti-sigma factor RsiW
MTLALPDELIMAFVDGELDPGSAASVRRAILTDEHIRRKHEIYRATRAVVSLSFAQMAIEPVPERLTSAIASQGRGKPV